MFSCVFDAPEDLHVLRYGTSRASEQEKGVKRKFVCSFKAVIFLLKRILISCRINKDLEKAS